MKKNIKFMVLGIILSMHLIACGDDSSKSNLGSDSNALAVVSIDNKEFKLPFVECTAPHSETKAYTVMALEVEDYPTEGASFRSFGSPNSSTIVFTPKPQMDSNGYNLSPTYSSKAAVDYKESVYRFTGKFDKVISGKIAEIVDGNIEVNCK